MTHFGLEIWIAHVRLEDYPVSNPWEMMSVYPPETTIAYLKLPGSKVNDRGGALTEWERDEKFFMIESGYAMSVKKQQPLSKSARRKFRRMMRILDLTPCLDDSQEGMFMDAD